MLALQLFLLGRNVFTPPLAAVRLLRKQMILLKHLAASLIGPLLVESQAGHLEGRSLVGTLYWASLKMHHVPINHQIYDNLGSNQYFIMSYKE